MARVFFALWPSPDLAEEMAEIAANSATRFGGKPTLRETIHLTLVFLGNVPTARLPVICRAAAGITAGAFELNIDQLGYWSHKRLLWAGCSVVPPELADLQAALAAVEIGQLRGQPAFFPHLTLVRRLSPPADLPKAQEPLIISPKRWPCQGFVLVRSRLSPAGPDYQILAEFPLVP